jgi:hypothetical protein
VRIVLMHSWSSVVLIVNSFRRIVEAFIVHRKATLARRKQAVPVQGRPVDTVRANDFIRS